MGVQKIFTVRASAWGKLFDCAYKFEWENILGHYAPAGLRALLGTSIHAGTAAYDASRLDGTNMSAEDAADETLKVLRNPEFDVDYTKDDLKLRDAETIALKLHTKYCNEIAPQFDYVDVETTLDALEIDCGGGIQVRLTGTMDRARVASTNDGIVIPDIKTGARILSNGAVNMSGKAAQLGTYQIMYEQTKRVPTIGSQIIGLSTSSKPAAAISPVFDARRVMLGTEDQPGLIQHAAEMFRSGLFPPNPQSQLCSEKYCARWKHCIFHS